MKRLWRWIKRIFVRPKPVPMPTQPRIDQGEFTPSKYKEHYRKLWKTMQVDRNKRSTVLWYVNKINEGAARYKEVEKETKVPWQLIGCKHLMEGAGDFNRVLHNGESLSSVNRYGTRLVPKGRGKGLNWTWEEAAVDALRIKKQPKEWTIENTLYYAERFNGLGYLRDPSKSHSPYIWSFTNHYTRGKYVRDGVYSPRAVSKQAGIAPVLKELGFEGA